MSLVATYQLDAAVNDSLFVRIPDLRLEIEQIVACSPDTLSVTLWAETEWRRFETALERAETVSTHRLLRAEGNRVRCQLRMPVVGTTYWDWTSLGGVLLDATATRQGVTVRMEFPDREAVTTYRKRCLEVDRGFVLRSLTDIDSASELNSRSLSVSQREILASAIESGYFGVPRGISMVELAAKHDISDQAASERLRRGLSNLLGDGTFDTLWAPPHPEAAPRTK